MVPLVTKSSISGSANALSASAATALTNVSSSAGAKIKTAQAQADTATTNASASQAAIDTMETQVVLDSGGMELRKLNGYKVAKYGTTTYFYDGTDSENVKLQLQAAGIQLYGDTEYQKATQTQGLVEKRRS